MFSGAATWDLNPSIGLLRSIFLMLAVSTQTAHLVKLRLPQFWLACHFILTEQTWYSNPAFDERTAMSRSHLPASSLACRLGSQSRQRPFLGITLPRRQSYASWDE